MNWDLSPSIQMSELGLNEAVARFREDSGGRWPSYLICHPHNAVYAIKLVAHTPIALAFDDKLPKDAWCVTGPPLWGWPP